MTLNGGVGGKAPRTRPSYSIQDTVDPYSHVNVEQIEADRERVTRQAAAHCSDDSLQSVLMMLGLIPTPARVKKPKLAPALKTHCPQGHEYTPDNTYTGAARRCKTCVHEQQKARRTVVAS